MQRQPRTAELICPVSAVAERGTHVFAVDYRGVRASALLIRYEGIVHGYLNRCVHMPKPLDVEHGRLFDDTGRYLQCSMHTIRYEPTTGECVSEICAGKRLTALKVREEAGLIYLVDKRARLPAG